MEGRFWGECWRGSLSRRIAEWFPRADHCARKVHARICDSTTSASRPLSDTMSMDAALARSLTLEDVSIALRKVWHVVVVRNGREECDWTWQSSILANMYCKGTCKRVTSFPHALLGGTTQAAHFDAQFRRGPFQIRSGVSDAFVVLCRRATAKIICISHGLLVTRRSLTT